MNTAICYSAHQCGLYASRSRTPKPNRVTLGLGELGINLYTIDKNEQEKFELEESLNITHSRPRVQAIFRYLKRFGMDHALVQQTDRETGGQTAMATAAR